MLDVVSTVQVDLAVRERLKDSDWGVGMLNTSASVRDGWWFQIFVMFTPTWGNDPI